MELADDDERDAVAERLTLRLDATEALDSTEGEREIALPPGVDDRLRS